MKPRPLKKPRELPLLELEMLEEGKKLTLEIKGDRTTIVDWVNGMPEPFSGMVGAEEWTCDNGFPMERHVFREHNEEADLWAAKKA